MGLYPSKEEIINSKRFNLEGPSKVHEQLENSNSDKIIITGERCSGKTASLKSYEILKVNNHKPYIYTNINEKDYNPYLKYNELLYKYNILLSLNILNYIKKYQPRIHKTYFSNIEDSIKERYKNFSKYINSKLNDRYALANNILIPKWLKEDIEKNDILESLVELVKKHLELDELNVILDHYDWGGNYSSRQQKILKSYLDLFDNYIITSDDRFIRNDKLRIADLTNKGFEIVNVEYGTDIDIAKDIIEKDITYWERNKYKYKGKRNINFISPKELLTESTYNKLIEKANGDFGVIFDALRPLYDYQYINFRDIDESVLKYLDESIKERTEEETKLKIKKLHM